MDISKAKDALKNLGDRVEQTISEHVELPNREELRKIVGTGVAVAGVQAKRLAGRYARKNPWVLAVAAVGLGWMAYKTFKARPQSA